MDFKKILTRDLAVRAFKTFVQAFVASLLLLDDPFTKQALIAALAAGLSALWNIALGFRK